ncbi:jg17836 [Pararge aegeria aegeria]|uniref:Jg17836 protein n=1 Tax=Pararge aegeria aegeria TaxID=348720 RepID=A0A8S4SH07_9NEOP|nr:jg17836 [Pararge aegeria aegeria]
MITLICLQHNVSLPILDTFLAVSALALELVFKKDQKTKVHIVNLCEVPGQHKPQADETVRRTAAPLKHLLPSYALLNTSGPSDSVLNGGMSQDVLLACSSFFFGCTVAYLRGCYGVTGGVGRARELVMRRAPGLDGIMLCEVWVYLWTTVFHLP